MIDSVNLVNFKCFEELTVNLGPFTVLIGPNDSGKSAFMESIDLVARLGGNWPGRNSEQLTAMLHRQPGGLKSLWHQHGLVLPIFVRARSGAELVIRLQDGQAQREVCFRYKPDGSFAFGINAVPASSPSPGPAVSPWQDKWFSETVAPHKYIHFNPTALKADSPINESEFRLDGQGFPTHLENILREDRGAFFEMEKAFYSRFPQYQSIMVNKDGGNNILQFKLKNGSLLHARQVSDGAVLYLAFMAVSCQPNPPSVYLVEEPETGVHPSGLRAIVDALRHLVERGKQIVVATHSPYLLDLVKPGEVRVFSRADDGTIQVQEMEKMPEMDVWVKHFNTGEIWTNIIEPGLLPAGEEK